jgi:hypothetical protein
VACVLILLPDTPGCSQPMENSTFSIGQNEIKRYKEKHVESAVATGKYATDSDGTRGHNFDAT